MQTYDRPGMVDCPNESTSIWRYMSLDNFIDLLQTRSLFFCRMHHFPDKWEGVIPKSLLDWVEERFAGKNPKSETTFAEYFRSVEIPRHAINCWHQKDVEENLMWKAYCKGNESVAIHTTVGRFRKAIKFSGWKCGDADIKSQWILVGGAATLLMA